MTLLTWLEVLAILLISASFVLTTTVFFRIRRLERQLSSAAYTTGLYEEQLEEMRHNYTLVMSDEDLQTLLAIGETDPEQLRHHVRAIRSLVEDLGSNESVQIKVEATPQEAGTYSDLPPNSRRRLTLSYAFA